MDIMQRCIDKLYSIYIAYALVVLPKELVVRSTAMSATKSECRAMRTIDYRYSRIIGPWRPERDIYT